MAKKFNGHRCERRNLTDLVLGTGPTGKKRAKPKAKKRPKNFFKPGGPTGGVQDNTRVNMPSPPPELQGPQGIYSLPQITRHPDELVGPRQNDYAYLGPYMQGIVDGEVESAMQHGGLEDARRQYNYMRSNNFFDNKEYNVLPEYRGRPGPNEERPFFTGFDEYYQPEVYATPEMDLRQTFSGLYREAGSEMDRGNVDAYRFHRLIDEENNFAGQNPPYRQYPNLRDQARRRMYGGPSALPQLYGGSPTANVLDMLSNYDQTTYHLPEGMNPASAIGKMALTSAYNQLPIEYLINNTGLPMDQAVMQYNAEQRAAQQPAVQQPTGGQPLDSVGGDLSYDYYVIDGETVALPAGSPPPMGAAIAGDPDAAAAAVTFPDNSNATSDVQPFNAYNDMSGTATYDPATQFSGTPLQIGDNAAARASFGDARLAPELAGSGLATDLFNSLALMQHGVAPNTPATTGDVAFGAPYAAPGNFALGPRNELADKPYDFMNFGAEQGMRNAFMPAGSSTTFDQDSPTGGVNMEAVNRAVMRQPFGLQPSGLDGNAGLSDIAGDFAKKNQSMIDGLKAKVAGLGKSQGQPNMMQQLGSQEGRANLANTLFKPGGTDLSALTESTGAMANIAKGGVNMLTNKVASTMEGDDGLFGAGMAGALRAGVGAAMMGSGALLPIAAVGAIGGIAKRKREMDLANKMDNQANLKTVQAVQGDLADYSAQVNSMMNERGQGYRFGRYGGPMGQADYETEGGEMMMASPNDPPMAMGQGQYDHQVGNMYKVRGPKHEQGGVPTAGAIEPYIDEFGQRQDSPYVYSDAKEFRIDPTPFLKMLR